SYRGGAVCRAGTAGQAVLLLLRSGCGCTANGAVRDRAAIRHCWYAALRTVVIGLFGGPAVAGPVGSAASRGASRRWPGLGGRDDELVDDACDGLAEGRLSPHERGRQDD